MPYCMKVNLTVTTLLYQLNVKVHLGKFLPVDWLALHGTMLCCIADHPSLHISMCISGQHQQCSMTTEVFSLSHV